MTGRNGLDCPLIFNREKRRFFFEYWLFVLYFYLITGYINYTNKGTDMNNSALTIEDRHQIAATILDQLGGTGRLRAMTGAHNFIVLAAGVSFKLKGRNAPGCGNLVRITLNSLDLYDIKVGTVRNYQVKWKHEGSDIYAENLKLFVETATGRYLSL